MKKAKNYISTEETKRITGLDDSGIRKLRKIYRDDNQIGARELFTSEQVEDLKEIVSFQRNNPHSSYLVAYKMLKQIKKNLFEEAPDDFTGLATLVMGEKNLFTFFDHFNALTDFLNPFDADSAKLLRDIQSLILAKIIITAQKS